MANSEQVKALIRCHAEGDDDRFYAVAMQVAAHAARTGHASHKGEDTPALHEFLDHGDRHGRVVLVVSDEVADLSAVDAAFFIDELEEDVAAACH